MALWSGAASFDSRSSIIVPCLAAFAALSALLPTVIAASLLSVVTPLSLVISEVLRMRDTASAEKIDDDGINKHVLEAHLQAAKESLAEAEERRMKALQGSAVDQERLYHLRGEIAALA
eukprot:TRINITY_DN22975_c0_g1_i1.p1 TRINITY_DN22975_c0_g1~~TRINITY_DN22975_c0_g1_i1.p1  ORF type:complete len:129 (+),score=31.14 TRINITY_DN22975_c0_g1_i1:31-387(+)